MAGKRRSSLADGDATTPKEEVKSQGLPVETKEVMKPKMSISQIKKPEPIAPINVVLRYFVIGFSMTWMDNGDYKRIDDTVRVDSLPGYPNLNELRKQIPEIFGVADKESVSVYNVIPMELSKEDFKQFTE